MLKVGRLADYGVLILHHLGRVRPARLSMETLSELTHVPLPTVRKVMRFLIEAGLALSKRGPLGGYLLARPTEAISLADAITALAGRPALVAAATPAPSFTGPWARLSGVSAIVCRHPSAPPSAAGGPAGAPQPTSTTAASNPAAASCSRKRALSAS